MQGIIENISEPIDVIVGDNVHLGRKIEIKVSNKIASKSLYKYIKNNKINYKIGDKIFFESRGVIDTFYSRLKKIGIEIELGGNFPWIYLDKINNVRVTETFQARHGFTAFFQTQEPFDSRKIDFTTKTKFSDRKDVFKLIRKYIEKTS